MNKIRDATLVPNAGVHGVGFVYKDKDSGKVFVHATVEQVIVMARKHRQANNYPVPPDFNQVVIDSICQNAPSGVCFDEPPPSAGAKAISLAKALYGVARSGFATLAPEQVEDRKKVCETSGLAGGSCEYFKGFNGLLSVYCGLCGCSKLKIHLKSSQCPKSLWPTM